MAAARTATAEVDVLGPWSLDTSRRFWEGFGPNRLTGQDGGSLTGTFLVDTDWSRATMTVRQDEQGLARVEVGGGGDLDAALAQVQRILAIDVDGRGWPEVGRRDPVIGAAQARRPGLRPCGFYSPYEAAIWSVLSQRVRIVQAASLRQRMLEQYGEDGAFPAPATLLGLELDLPGRKPEYVRAVAEAASDGVLGGAVLRQVSPEDAVAQVQQIKGLGPFAAELVVLRGANAPDLAPTQEKRLEAEVAERYGAGTTVADVAEHWRPFRTWASVCLRSLRAE